MRKTNDFDDLVTINIDNDTKQRSENLIPSTDDDNQDTLSLVFFTSDDKLIVKNDGELLELSDLGNNPTPQITNEDDQPFTAADLDDNGTTLVTITGNTKVFGLSSPNQEENTAIEVKVQSKAAFLKKYPFGLLNYEGPIHQTDEKNVYFDSFDRLLVKDGLKTIPRYEIPNTASAATFMPKTLFDALYPEGLAAYSGPTHQPRAYKAEEDTATSNGWFSRDRIFLNASGVAIRKPNGEFADRAYIDQYDIAYAIEVSAWVKPVIFGSSLLIGLWSLADFGFAFRGATVVYGESVSPLCFIFSALANIDLNTICVDAGVLSFLALLAQKIRNLLPSNSLTKTYKILSGIDLSLSVLAIPALSVICMLPFFFSVLDTASPSFINNSLEATLHNETSSDFDRAIMEWALWVYKTIPETMPFLFATFKFATAFVFITSFFPAANMVVKQSLRKTKEFLHYLINSSVSPKVLSVYNDAFFFALHTALVGWISIPNDSLAPSTDANSMWRYADPRLLIPAFTHVIHGRLKHYLNARISGKINNPDPSKTIPPALFSICNLVGLYSLMGVGIASTSSLPDGFREFVQVMLAAAPAALALFINNLSAVVLDNLELLGELLGTLSTCLFREIPSCKRNLFTNDGRHSADNMKTLAIKLAILVLIPSTLVYVFFGYFTGFGGLKNLAIVGSGLSFLSYVISYGSLEASAIAFNAGTPLEQTKKHVFDPATSKALTAMLRNNKISHAQLDKLGFMVVDDEVKPKPGLATLIERELTWVEAVKKHPATNQDQNKKAKQVLKELMSHTSKAMTRTFLGKRGNRCRVITESLGTMLAAGLFNFFTLTLGNQIGRVDLDQVSGNKAEQNFTSLLCLITLSLLIIQTFKNAEIRWCGFRMPEDVVDQLIDNALEEADNDTIEARQKSTSRQAHLDVAETKTTGETQQFTDARKNAGRAGALVASRGRVSNFGYGTNEPNTTTGTRAVTVFHGRRPARPVDASLTKGAGIV